MSEIKSIPNNWRNISKSDYIASIDVESIIKNNSGRCILTVETAIQHLSKDDQDLPRKQRFTVNGNRGNFNIIHFKEDVKPFVVNVTNSQIMWRFVDTGKAEDEAVSMWAGLTIELIVDKSIEFMGSVGGIVILNELPVTKLEDLHPEHVKWDEFKDRVKNRIDEEYEQVADIDAATATVRANLSKYFTISDENWGVLCG